jgi:hypothetical protein
MQFEVLVWMRQGKYLWKALVNTLTNTLFPQYINFLSEITFQQNYADSRLYI